ncbi:MAG: hypothetical protein ACP5VS_03970 [Desulfomonilaceae bacterium]
MDLKNHLGSAKFLKGSPFFRRAHPSHLAEDDKIYTVIDAVGIHSSGFSTPEAAAFQMEHELETSILAHLNNY